MPYSFDPETGEYIDLDTGDVLTAALVLALLNSALENLKAESTVIAGLVVGGTLSVSDWESQAQELVTTAFLWYLWAAVGGVNNTTADHYARLSSVLQNQMAFLTGFAAAISSGDLSEAMIAARLGLYFTAATQIYEIGRLLVTGVPDVGVYPGDCSTDCCTNCLCHWEIETLDGLGNFNLRWRLGVTEKHCRHCPERAARWNPLRVRNGVLIDPIDTGDSSLFIQRSRRDCNGLPLHPDVLVAELIRRQTRSASRLLG